MKFIQFTSATIFGASLFKYHQMMEGKNRGSQPEHNTDEIQNKKKTNTYLKVKETYINGSTYEQNKTFEYR